MKSISVLGAMLAVAWLGAAGQPAAQESGLDVKMRVVEDASNIDAVVIELRGGADAGDSRNTDDDEARGRGVREEANDDGQNLAGDHERTVGHDPDDPDDREDERKRSDE